MAVELRQVTPDGDYGEILPDWSDLTFSQDLLNPGALTFNYPLDGRNAEVLRHNTVLTCLLDGQEPMNGRFTYSEGQGSRLGDSGEQNMASFGCSSTIDRFKNMLLAPAFGSVFADENMFDFKNKTAGWLVTNAINNAMSRGNQLSGNPQEWLTHPITTFDEVYDSAGKMWPTTYDVKFPPGTKVQGVFDWVVGRGFAEPQMVGKELRLYSPENNGRNLTTGSKPTVLQTGRDLIEATYQTTSKDLVNALLVLGDDNTCVWVYDQDSINQFGYREDTLTVGNASSVSTLTAAGNVYLSTRKIPRYSYTYSVGALYLESVSSVARPFIDYQVGDSILILDGVFTSVQRLRLLSATWPSSRSATVNLTVNDFFAERDVEFDRRITRLGNT